MFCLKKKNTRIHIFKLKIATILKLPHTFSPPLHLSIHVQLQKIITWHDIIKQPFKENRTEKKRELQEKYHLETIGWLEFNGQVNTLMVMSSLSVYLTTLFLGRLSPLSGKPVLVHILSQETDNCLSWNGHHHSLAWEDLIQLRVRLKNSFIKWIDTLSTRVFAIFINWDNSFDCLLASLYTSTPFLTLALLNKLRCCPYF